MGNAFWFEWEPGLIIFIQSHITPFLQKIAEAVTFWGDEYAMILIMGILYWGCNKELGKRIGLYAITSLVTDIGLNNIVKRRRPYFDHEEIKCLKPRSSEGDIYDLTVQGYSFPSGHSVNSVTTFGVLGANARRKALKVLFYAFMILIGLSRLALGVHYPTDVLSGWLLSALVILLVSRIKDRRPLYLLIAGIGIAGCFFSTSNDYYSALGMAFGFMAGFTFEEKRVNFENTPVIWRMILRTAGGLVIFLGLNTALKLPFSEEFLSSVTPSAFLVRTLRYTVVSFILTGIYPMCFGLNGKRKKT